MACVFRWHFNSVYYIEFYTEIKKLAAVMSFTKQQDNQVIENGYQIR